MIDLYTAATPNGWKVAILLEELEAEYDLHLLSLADNEQKMPEYLALNPNGKIPAIVDRDAEGFAVFESGAILIYLADMHDRFLPVNVKRRSQVIQWLMLELSGLGPAFTQAYTFTHDFSDKLPAVIERYQQESRRLVEVLDRQLQGRDYLCDEYSIADMAHYPWVAIASVAGISIDGLDNLQAWLERVGDRPAVQRGMQTPAPS